VSALTVVVHLDHLSPTPSTSSFTKIPENTEEQPDESKPAEERDIQTKYSSDELYNASIKAV
jgi:hypothetical protein